MPEETTDLLIVEMSEEEARKIAQRKAMKEQYVKLGCQPRTNIIKRLLQEIDMLEANINTHQQGLVANIREVDNRKDMLAAMHILPSVESKEVEFDRLMENPDIESLVVEGYKITVHTVPIEIEYMKQTYYIGRFVIWLSTDPSSSGWLIKFKNLTNAINGYPHPHVNTNGTPCLGNIKACLPQMVGANQFAAAISVAIQYLKSYSDTEAGKPYVQITNWPVINKLVIPPPQEEEEEEDNG